MVCVQVPAGPVDSPSPTENGEIKHTQVAMYYIVVKQFLSCQATRCEGASFAYMHV